MPFQDISASAAIIECFYSMVLVVSKIIFKRRILSASEGM